MDANKQAVEQHNEIIINILKDVEGLFENVTHPGKAETDPRVRPVPWTWTRSILLLNKLVGNLSNNYN